MSDAGTTTPEQDAWIELSVEVDAEAVEPVSELFARYGFNEGVAIDQPFTQEADGDNLAVDLSRPFTVRTFIAAGDVPPGAIDEVRKALWYLGHLRHVGELHVLDRREGEWAEAWKEHYRPQRIGDRLVVRPPWYEYEATGSDLVMVLDPGMAFGTGLHPSTRLSVIGLERQLRPGMRVLDVGCGSGVLAIGALLLGAGHVDAVDIEPVAVRATRENAARNGLADALTVAEGSVGPDEPFQGHYDLVLANIIARVLTDLADSLVAAIAPGGAIVLAGIIEGKEPGVRAAFDAHGLTLINREQMEDWVSLVYRRP